MSTAFTSSLLGLGGSLTIGFLGLQVQFAQNAIFRELEDYLAAHTRAAMPATPIEIIPQINQAARNLDNSVKNLERVFSELD